MTPAYLLAHLHLVNLARSSAAYCRQHRIDYRAVEPACGGVHISPLRLVPPHGFEPDPDGTPAAWCEAFAEDAETVLDVVAWSLNDPSKVRVLTGATPALGMAAAVNPATYFDGAPLHLYRTPLNWLQAGCNGSVILDPVRGARWLLDVNTTRFAVEDDAHANELLLGRRDLFSCQTFVVPIRKAASSFREAA